MARRAIVIYSGGLDSTTLLYHLRAADWELKALSVDYGQRHRQRELTSAETVCAQLGVERQVLDLRSLVGFFGKNGLTDLSIAVPEGPYEAATLPLTTVPNRNMVLLSVGIAWAVSLSFEAVAFGAHSGPRTNYPDCSPDFAEAMDRAAHECDDRKISVLAPFVTWDKGDIVRRGAELGVPFDLTWSCYQGGAKHCGQCGTCIDRREAFRKCGLADPVPYGDEPIDFIRPV
jgi:7-cyano-7-deazaguanine synthase